MNATQTFIVNVRTVTSFSDEPGGLATVKKHPQENRPLTYRRPWGGRSEDPFSTLVEQRGKPAVNLFELNSKFIIEADVAGASPSDLDIQVTPDHVLLTLPSRTTEASGNQKILSYGLNLGEIKHSIPLPRRIDPENVTAEYKSGLLRIYAKMAE